VAKCWNSRLDPLLLLEKAPLPRDAFLIIAFAFHHVAIDHALHYRTGVADNYLDVITGLLPSEKRSSEK
jgi:hypothetical protein